jgi:hypothetical protein
MIVLRIDGYTFPSGGYFYLMDNPNILLFMKIDSPPKEKIRIEMGYFIIG